MDTDSQNYHLRWAGAVGTLPLPAMIIGFAIGQFPWPDDNLDGHVYLDYELPRHFGEVGTLVWLMLTAAQVLFVWLLAVAYIRQSGRITMSAMVMVGGGATSAATALVFASTFLTIAVMGRGFQGSGGGLDHPALMVIAYSWNLTEICFALNTVLLGLIWFAIAAANRHHRILPAGLARAAVAVGVIDVASLVSVFIPTGPWSPGSVGNVLPGAVATYVWIMVGAVTLLSRHGLPTGLGVKTPSHIGR
ncbi:hypothetical protein ACFXPS_41745 [Nocardia sp. NPDC059091]|uniref:hypothetical protein n=1 Tax=unclassified Nocardia TaxID=2637762 RepID=UPI0036AD4495